MTSFTAHNENCVVSLNWTVSEAKDFSQFVVQRSTDARNFVSLAKITYDATIADYSFTDSPFKEATTPARNYYYRLQLVDMDQSVHYSTIRGVDGGTCDNRLSVVFYPSPVENELSIKSYSALRIVEIYSVDGKRVSKSVPSGNQTEIHVDVRSLVQGLYVVNIVNDQGRHTAKVFKK